MRLLELLGILLLLGLAQAVVIKCYAGNSAKYNRQALSMCTSMSYCVSIKHKSGVFSYSCDGNSISQVALCSLFKAKSPANDYFYASQIGASSTNHRPSRPLSDSSQSCYDAGELGTLCCCTSDYCNSSYPLSVIVVFFICILLLF